jgi:hypothetical protein
MAFHDMALRITWIKSSSRNNYIGKGCLPDLESAGRARVVRTWNNFLVKVLTLSHKGSMEAQAILPS